MSFVLRRISTGEILRRDIAPENVPPPQNITDPDLEFLPFVEWTVPAYDPRYFVLTIAEGKDGGSWVRSYGTAKRPVEEIVQSLDNAKRLEAAKQLSNEESLEVLTLMVGVLLRKVSGLSLTVKEQTLADRLSTASAKLWKNRDRHAALKAAIEAGGEPDLDEGWEPA